jgi:hypothetical protein
MPLEKVGRDTGRLVRRHVAWWGTVVQIIGVEDAVEAGASRYRMQGTILGSSSGKLTGPLSGEAEWRF